MTNLWYLITIASSFVSVILGIAYSILSESISKIEEKYDSRVIIDSFEEKKNKFKKSLQTSVFVIFGFLFFRYIVGIISGEQIMDIITIIFALLLLATTIHLIIDYFEFIDDINTYKSPLKLLKFFTSKKNSFNDENCFKVVEDILFYSLKKKDWELNRKASEFIYQSFLNRRKNHE